MVHRCGSWNWTSEETGPPTGNGDSRKEAFSHREWEREDGLRERRYSIEERERKRRLYERERERARKIRKTKDIGSETRGPLLGGCPVEDEGPGETAVMAPGAVKAPNRPNDHEGNAHLRQMECEFAKVIYRSEIRHRPPSPLRDGQPGRRGLWAFFNPTRGSRRRS